MTNEDKPIFYSTNWFLYVTLVLLPPVGIFYMWKYKRFSGLIRKLLTIGASFSVLFMGLVVYSVASTTPEQWAKIRADKTQEAATKQALAQIDAQKKVADEVANQAKSRADAEQKKISDNAKIAKDKADAELKAKQTEEAKVAAAAKEKADAEARVAVAAKEEADAKAKTEADKAAAAAAETRANDRLKSEAVAIPYKDLARNPDTYMYNKVKFTGEVIQVIEDGNNVALRVNVTKNSYGYEDTILVNYSKNVIAGRTLEKDIITFYGKYYGLTTYTTVLGAKMTLPRVRATIIDLEK